MSVFGSFGTTSTFSEVNRIVETDLRMEFEIVSQQVNALQLKIIISNNYQPPSSVTKISPKYIISGAAVFQVKVIITLMKTDNRLTESFLIFIKFFKLLQEDNLTYTIKIKCNELGLGNKNFISDDGTWHVLSDDTFIVRNCGVTLHMDTVPSASPFAMLHEDTELADFELRGEDGSVRVHRAVLAAASPVLRRMLSGTWREATEGRVDVPGTSKVTLQNLKDYVYLHTLPDNGLEQLLLLASCYMIKDLEQNCIFKIVSSITTENACDLMEFATKHKVPQLLLAILECAKIEILKLDELRKRLLGSK